MNTLQRIIQYTERRIEYERKHLTLGTRCRPIKDFRGELERTQFAIIAEYKPSSPSGVKAKWDIEDYIYLISPCASAISVLTEPKWFKGSYTNLRKIANITDKPVLFKDFVIDTFQIDIAYSFGADAILLTLEVLGEDNLKYLAKYTKNKGLQTLVELPRPEYGSLFDKEPYIDVIGFNSRDFTTLTTNIYRIANGPRYVSKKFVLAESGIKTRHQAFLVGSWGYRGALVGTSLMEDIDPRTRCLELKEAGNAGLFWLP